LTHIDILNDLRQGKYAPIYFLHGDEPYYIDLISDFIEKHVLSESERSFNLTILYGKDVDHKTVIDNARRFPMMAANQVVILKEAQTMKSIQDLDIYLENPLESTLLVICYKHKKLDKRTKFAKVVQKHALVLESKRPYDNQMPQWISSFLKEKGFTIQAAEANLVAEYLGNSLSKVANELDKLVINLPVGHTVNKDDIEEHIGISKEYNIFELQNALGTRDQTKSYRIIKYFQSNPRNNPLVMIIGTLYSFFSKIYMIHFMHHAPEREIQKTLGLSSGYFIKDYKKAAQVYNQSQTEQVLHLLRLYDLKAKGVDRASFSDQAILQELVYHILAI